MGDGLASSRVLREVHVMVSGIEGGACYAECPAVGSGCRATFRLLANSGRGRPIDVVSAVSGDPWQKNEESSRKWTDQLRGRRHSKWSSRESGAAVAWSATAVRHRRSRPPFEHRLQQPLSL